MRTLLTLATILIGLTGTAAADTSHDSPAELQLRAAERQANEDSRKVVFEAQETMIAERDLDSARLQIDVSNDAWARAVEANHANAAGAWAVDHYNAMVEERDARGRYESHRAGRDIARADFRRDVHLVHMCMERMHVLSARR